MPASVGNGVSGNGTGAPARCFGEKSRSGRSVSCDSRACPGMLEREVPPLPGTLDHLLRVVGDDVDLAMIVLAADPRP